jgi:Rod binding domain-containing protein
MSGILPLTASASPSLKAGSPTKTQDAAQQFEALLLSQILHSSHESGGGWLSSGSDSSGECATDYAEQQLATTLAQQGGLGLAKLIVTGLEKKAH